MKAINDLDPKKNTIRVLIAEDNPIVSKIIENLVRKIGCIPIGIATDGSQAINFAIAERPDVILMDIEMPKVDGLEATAKILQQYSVPIIIISAHGNKEIVKKASKAGVAAFLVKAPNEKEIERAIIIAMARHHDLIELKRVNAELKKALAEVNTLRGIIPICSSCRKIRDDKGYWAKLEHYMTSHSGVQFSHGVCPKCAIKLYPECAAEIMAIE